MQFIINNCANVYSKVKNHSLKSVINSNIYFDQNVTDYIFVVDIK